MDSLHSAIRTYVLSCGEREDTPRVEELAATLGVNVRTLRRWCTTQFGKRPRELLEAAKIELADTLLHTTKLTTAIIAKRSGFMKQTDFFRIYKLHRGCTPRGRGAPEKRD